LTVLIDNGQLAMVLPKAALDRIHQLYEIDPNTQIEIHKVSSSEKGVASPQWQIRATMPMSPMSPMSPRTAI
jgi:hypothetical protein